MLALASVLVGLMYSKTAVCPDTAHGRAIGSRTRNGNSSVKSNEGKQAPNARAMRYIILMPAVPRLSTWTSSSEVCAYNLIVPTALHQV